METVLITGAARRIGSLIAKDLAGAGCFIWIHYRSHEQEALLLREQIRANGGNAECVSSDLTKTEEIDAMFDQICDSEYGKLTTLINNASMFLPGTIQSASVSEWDRVMNTNLRAVWYLSAQFAERFPSGKRIISIGDASVQAGYSEHAVYGLSKFALKYLTSQMAAAFSPAIRVNLLSPGFVLRGDDEPEPVWQKRIEKTLNNNDKIVDSLLKGIRFLMEDPGMTGSELIIDNGLQMYRKNDMIK